MAFDRNEAADVAFGHRPVLLDECVEGLAIHPDGIYLDGTLGLSLIHILFLTNNSSRGVEVR